MKESELEKLMLELLIGFSISMVLVLILGKFAIPFLHKLKFGQEIREEGPAWHKEKSGTPTMGGILFVVASLVAVFVSKFDEKVIIILLTGILFGAIGFLDDYIKVIKKRNLGLTAKQKFLAQFVVATAFTAFLIWRGIIGYSIFVPFAGFVDIGFLFVPFAIFVILATVNSVNLTDGLDGLAATVTVFTSGFFGAAAWKLDQPGIVILMAVIIGGLIGFLFYNWHPAKVFMGDTGALFLGGIISATVVVLGLELFILISCFVYFMETLSVALQVISFKLTGKRIFKMSPIHHHFEMIGFSEVKIVALFSIITIVLSVTSYFLLTL